jgi:hypothetical protein
VDFTEGVVGVGAYYKPYGSYVRCVRDGDVLPPDESVGGTVTGQTGIRTVCINRTTGQRVAILMHGGKSWDCESAGLLVAPGDVIIMKSIGVVD